MLSEHSYDNGRKHFQPDTTRGHWAQPNDFIFLCLGLAFNLDFFFAPMTNLIRMGIFAFVPYVICLALYTVPIMVIQSFLGQFSSSGFISAFRVSPFFKGMGYVSLALNSAILTYYSNFATTPMFFFFNSLKPILPWSCEEFQKPDTNWPASKEVQFAICNASDANRTRAEADMQSYTNIYPHLPTRLLFISHFPSSWEHSVYILVLWSIVGVVFLKYFNTSKLGQILRYAIWITLFLLAIFIVRFMCLPGALHGLSQYILPKADDNELNGFVNVLIYSIQAFGPGWGSIITLSSFNKFNRNIMRDSWIICLGQMLIFMAFNFATMLLNWHFTESESNDFADYSHSNWEIYFSGGSAIANMSYANLWSLLFYFLLTLAALIVMITQIYALLVSIFDEFENLRPHKLSVALMLIAVLAALSTLLCMTEGIYYFSLWSIGSLFTQVGLNLLLLLVILWVYGRERFQRDIEFMLRQPFATWKVNMLRFIAPLCLLLIFISSKFSVIHWQFVHSFYVQLMEIVFILLPCVFIAVYGLAKAFEASGTWKARLQRSFRPTDWYPAEPDDRTRYEEAHQLNNLREGVL